MTHSFANQQIADMFAEIEAALVVQNDDRFRIRAYQNAISIFSMLQEPLETYWRAGTLMTIPGIGGIFAKKIDELFTTGTIKEFEDIRSGLPEGMFELLKVEGIGPKNAFKLAKTFKLNNRADAIEKLIKLATDGEIAKLAGFGEKSQALIIENAQRYQTYKPDTRIPLYRADQIIAQIGSYLDNLPEIITYSPLGSHRRRKETVGDIDIGIATNEPEKIVEHLVSLPKLSKILAQGDKTVRMIWGEGINVDFKLVPPSQWGSLLQHFTGSKAHNVALRELAISKGMSMSEQGMKIAGKWHRYDDEKDFYQALSLAWIPPEMRENQGEIELARSNIIPDLIKIDDMKGDLHTHTNYHWINSHDAGQSSPDEIIDQAIELGYEYIALGDHNPSLKSYSSDEIIRQIIKRNNHIEQINTSYEKRVKKSTIKIFKSLEIDIRPDGTLAVPDDGVNHLDFVIASIHSTFKQSRQISTDRILKALSHPKVKILGHPTGRLIGKRDPIDADWLAIFDYCIKHHKALEINASPDRLDLPWLLVKKAAAQGALFTINTDAHHASQLKGLQSGIDVARRGWLTQAQVVNAWSHDKFANWLVT